METLTNEERALTASALKEINYLGYKITDLVREIKYLKSTENAYNNNKLKSDMEIEFRYHHDRNTVRLKLLDKELINLLISLSLKSLDEELENKQKNFDNLLAGIKEDKKPMISRFRKFIYETF